MPTPEFREARWQRIRGINSPSLEPTDFAAFWRKTLAELVSVDPDPTFEQLAGHQEPGSIIFHSLGGARIRAWIASPPQGNRGAPLLITSHGYGGAVEAERIRRLASLGFVVIGVDIRGFGRSKDAVDGLSPHGYVMTGADDPQQSILRGAICDYLQAYRLLASMATESKPVCFQGFSFAGGLALMAASVLEINCNEEMPACPDLLAIGAPTFGFLERRLSVCEGGSGKETRDYLKTHPEKATQVKQCLSYFDACHFARRLYPNSHSAPPRIVAGVGLHDPIVPAGTVYAILNACRRKPEIIELPCSHTDRPEEAEWVRWESRWIKLGLAR